MCESHPVIYGKSSSESSTPRKSNQQMPNDGYSVKLRTKPRKGMDGAERTTSKITNISIDNRPNDQEEVLLSYEDFLDINVKTKKSPRKSITEPAMQPPVKTPVKSPPRKDSATEKSPVSREQSQEILISRPVTALSKMSMESDLDLVVAPGACRSNVTTPLGKTSSTASLRQGSNSRGGPRTTSAGRPPPQKPSLHKTSAAVGASIQAGGTAAKVAETEYIHFSQQLIGSQEMDLPKRASSTSNSATAILSVGNHNNPLEEVRSESPALSQQPLPSSPSVGSLGSPRALSDDGNVPTPPSSPKDQRAMEKEEEEKPDEVHYAFNIPTADTVESEIDPSELHPVIEETREEEEGS